MLYDKQIIVDDDDVIMFHDFEYKRYYLENIKTKYFVNSDGFILNTYKEDWRLVKQYSVRGYKVVYLSINNKLRRMPVHSIVMTTFKGCKPNQSMQIDHIDGKKWNNNVHNLEWATPSENIRRAWSNDLCTSREGDKHHNIKYSDKDIFEALILIKSGASALQTSKVTKIPTSQLYRVLDGSRRRKVLLESGLEVSKCNWIYEHPNLRIFKEKQS